MKALLLVLLCLYSSTTQCAQKLVRFGIVAHPDDVQARQLYAPLHQYLASRLAPDQVQLVWIPPAQLLSPLQDQTDLLLADPYHYLQIHSKNELISPVLSLITLTESGQFEFAGGVILCLASNPLCDLSRLSGAQIAATGPYSLFGYAAQLKELQQLNIQLSADAVQHLTSDHAVIMALKNHDADIGFVRTGVLENMIQQGHIAPGDMKILNHQELAELPVQSSTRLYPDWPVLVMPQVSPALLNRIMAVLLEWENQARRSGLHYAFGAAVNYQSVEHTLQTLALPPYQDAASDDFIHSWTDHRGTLLFIICLVLLILGLFIGFRTKIVRQRNASIQLQHQNQKLQLQKAQMSTVLNNTVHLLLFGLDAQGRIVHCNDNALKLMQATEQNLQGQLLADWLSDPAQKSALESAMQHLQQNPAAAKVLSLKIQLHSGKELYLDSDLFRLPGAPADGSEFILLGTDVSRRYWIEQRLQKSFKRLDQLIERSPSVIYAFDPVTMRLNYISPNCFTMYLKSSMEIMRMANWWNLSVHPDNQQVIAQKFIEWANSGYPGVLKYSCTLLRHSAHASLYVEDPQQMHHQICIENQLCALRDEQGKVTEVIGSQLDISERHQAQMKQELAASVFVQAREGIFITDADGTILDLNHSFCRITGYSEQEALGCHLALLGTSQADKLYFESLWQELIRAGYWEGELQSKRKNGESMVLAMTISVVQDVMHHPLHYVALFSDITIQKAQEDKLRFIAHFDALTGLPNRLLLKDRIAQNMALAKRKKQLMAIIFIDIDGFKAVNDSLGHEAGDYLLVELANRMRAVMRENDTLARLGGDEFIALLTDLSSETDCIPLIERLLQSASKPVDLQKQQARVSASIGITFYPQKKPVDDATLLRQADMAMYQAKHSGKNQYAIFSNTDKELVS